MTAPAASSPPLAGDADVAALQRHTLRVLLASQVLAGAGLAAGVTVGALLAEDMLHSTGLSGLPAALLTLGSTAAAMGVGRLSQRSGRRPGLAAGYAVGAVGGAGTATNLQARYAGADLTAPQRRGRAVSTVLVATTLGAVAGPNMVEPMGSVAAALGIPELAGPFLLATVAYALAGVVVSLALRPDPLVTARAIADEAARAATAAGTTAPVTQTNTVLLRLGATAMIATQLVMVAIMTMTPVHMREHGHGLGAAGLVISLHIAAMFLPSPVTGVLVDRLGRRPLIAASGVTLFAAGLLAATAPDDSVVLLALALILLGLGWNLGLVAGTALLTDAVPLARRARTQGTVDLGVALAGATGGLGGGLVVATTSFAVLGLAGGLVAVALVPALLVSRPRTARGGPVAAEGPPA